MAITTREDRGPVDELESRWLQFVLLHGRVLVESDVPLISVPSVGSAEFGPFFFVL